MQKSSGISFKKFLTLAGIVRRIDELGRVVVPKEIRRTLRIREGDPLEIYTDKEGSIILRKFSHMGELESFSEEYAQALSRTSGHSVMISDRDQIIAVSGIGRDYLGKGISRKLEKSINGRENIFAQAGEAEFMEIVEDDKKEFVEQCICPIITNGDVVGAIMILRKEDKPKMSMTEMKMALCASEFIGRHLEE